LHEVSLAQSLLDVLEESAREQGITRVHRVKVVVGQWSAVLPEALSTSFELLAAHVGPPLTGAELTIAVNPAVGECTTCGERYDADEKGLSCPACGGTARLVSGTELYIDSYEGE